MIFDLFRKHRPGSIRFIGRMDIKMTVMNADFLLKGRFRARQYLTNQPDRIKDP